MTLDYQQVRGSRQGVGGVRGHRSRALMGHPTLDLIDHARGCLAEAASATSAHERFAAAHLAALRAAAAVLAARALPVDRRRGGRPARRAHGPRNVWELLPAVAPELSEWAAFFAANAGKRAAAQAGLRDAVTAREADDLLRDADALLGQVCVLLGLPYQEPLDGPIAGLLGDI